MDPDSWITLVLVALALLLSSLATAAEAALGSLGPAHLHRLSGLPEATSPHEADEVAERASLVLSAVALVKALALVAAAAGGASLIARLLPAHESLALTTSGLLVVGVVLVQIVPRAAALQCAEEVARWAISPARASALVLGPVIVGLSAVTRFGLRCLGAKLVSAEPTVSGEDLRHMVNVGQDIPEDEREMLHGIFELQETSVREIMVPRIDIAAVPAETPLAEVVDLVIAEGHSRIPVFSGSVDTIVGIAYAKDLLRHLRAGEVNLPVQGIVRPAHFVPESKRVDELLRELQRKKVHIAIVVDEYGGTSGLVTIEDLLEEIVGEIQDEYDAEEQRIFTTGGDEAVFDGMVSVEDVNQTLGLHLEADGVDTIGGLVYQQLGRVPSVGDEVQFEEGVITVLSVVRRRIKRVRVRRERPSDEAEGAASDQWPVPEKGRQEGPR